MLKQLSAVVFGIFLILQPFYLVGQDNRGQGGIRDFQSFDDLFSSLDTAFAGEPTPEDEYYLGRAVAANILAAYMLYTADNELTNYVNLICQALVINSDYPDTFNGYHVMILDNRELNALSTPGGHIFITKGLLDIVSSEDALAGVIAHEMAHVMLKHGMKMIDDMKIVSQADEMAERAAVFSGRQTQRIASFRGAVNGYFDAMVKSGYSQPQEFEADTLAVKLLAGAGYSPVGLLEIVKNLQNIQKTQSGGFFSTHPAPADRAANIEKQVSAYRMTDNSPAREERFLRIMGR